MALSQEPESPRASKLSYSLQVTSKVRPTSDPACPLKLLIEGVGLTNLLGPVRDVQSHCIRQDGTLDHGVFTFAGAALGGLPGGDDSSDTISGQYRAHLVPSLTSVLSNPPAGYWLGYGEVLHRERDRQIRRRRKRLPDLRESRTVLPRTRRTRSQYWAVEYLRHRHRAFQRCRVRRCQFCHPLGSALKGFAHCAVYYRVAASMADRSAACGVERER